MFHAEMLRIQYLGVADTFQHPDPQCFSFSFFHEHFQFSIYQSYILPIIYTEQIIAKLIKHRNFGFNSGAL